MKLHCIFSASLWLFLACHSLETLRAETGSADDRALRLRALSVMQDVVPTPASLQAIAEVTSQKDHALCGHIFGDAEVGALVSVQMQAAQLDHASPGADLCLLLWKDGWQFAQAVGKVSPNENDNRPPSDWALKERSATHTFYVISNLDLNQHDPRLSWFCDPATHRLVPTGWRTDFLPSISKDTITFTGQEKPGYSPLIWEIHRFDGSVGPLLARRTGGNAQQRDQGEFITVHAPNHKGWETWRIWDRSREYHFERTIYGLARIAGDDIKGAPVGEATAEFSRSESFMGGSIATLFLQCNLTGLNPAALEGNWDQDARRNFPQPAWVKIMGDAEAVERFSWPPLGSDAKLAPSATPVADH